MCFSKDDWHIVMELFNKIKHRNTAFIGLLGIFTLVSSSASAEGELIALDVKPNRCIALHQGQICYQTLRFQWLTPAIGEYCLYQQAVSEPLLCWSGKKITTVAYEFESDRSLAYQIRRKGEENVLAQAQVKIAWVYKKGRKSASGWRLF